MYFINGLPIIAHLSLKHDVLESIALKYGQFESIVNDDI